MELSCPWVGLTHGLGWVGSWVRNGSSQKFKKITFTEFNDIDGHGVSRQICCCLPMNTGALLTVRAVVVFMLCVCVKLSFLLFYGFGWVVVWVQIFSTVWVGLGFIGHLVGLVDSKNCTHGQLRNRIFSKW